MINIDKDYLITVDLKNTKVKSDKTIFFYNTDLNICNIFIKLICTDEDKTIPEDLIVEFAVLKPETDEFKPLDATLISKEDLLYQVDLTTDYFDIVGKYSCEIRVSGTIENELKCFTSEEFDYVVKPNITAKLNKKIKNDKNLPVLEKLIKDVKEITDGINKNEIQMKRDENLVGDNKTIVGAINQLREDVDSGIGGGTAELKDYQKKNDEFLNTDEKTITGGINEVNNKIKKVQESQIELDKDDISFNGIDDISHDELNTTNKTLIGAINEVNSQCKDIANEKATKQELEVERARINNISSLKEGSTTGDAELIDGRVGADRITYNNIGEAIRGQVKDIKNDLDVLLNVEKLLTTATDDSFYNVTGATTSIYISNHSMEKGKTIKTIKMKCGNSGTGHIYVINNDNKVVDIINISVTTGWNIIYVNKKYDCDVRFGFYGVGIKYSDHTPTDSNCMPFSTDGKTYSSTTSNVEVGTTLTVSTVTINLYFAIEINCINNENANSIKKPGKMLIVDQTNTDCYNTITDAVSSATSEDIIWVMPGTYIEDVQGFVHKDINIIGFDRDTCILKNSYATYERPPLEISGGMVKNLTIIAENDEVTTPENSGYTQGNYKWGAYAVHFDQPMSAGRRLIIENCKLESYWNAGIGIGFYGNDSLTLKNCEIITHSTYDYGNNAGLSNGALIVHPRQKDNIKNQNFIMDGCKLRSNTGIAMKISGLDKETSILTVSAYNNILYSEVNGQTNTIKISGLNGGTGIGGLKNVLLTGDSFGNNNNLLNA